MQGKRKKILGGEAEALALALKSDFDDHEAFCGESLAIRDKSGRQVPFVLQPAQRKLNELIRRQRGQRKPVRVIVLKARQVMISSATAAQFFHKVPWLPGQKGRIVAHIEDSAKLIFSYYHQFQEYYQPFAGRCFLPQLIKDAEDKGIIEWKNRSSFQIQTARNVEAGRGGSFRYLHLSEFGFWPDAETLMTGLMQTVPDDPDTCVVIESTANGMGGPFYERWQEAIDPSSGSEWAPLFFAWHEHPEYAFEPEEPARFQDSITREELDLQHEYSLTLAQINWRRWAIRNRCQGSLDAFRQEFPANAVEAFIFSGRPRFSHTHLVKMPVDNEGGLVGELQEVQNGPKTVLHFLPDRDGRGALTVYKKPNATHHYSIGVDVAEGVDIYLGKGSRIDPDYSVAIVLDRDNGEEVAQLRGRIEPGAFGEYIVALGRWYNWAYLTPETNGPGLATIEAILREGYPPALIYHRRPAVDEQFGAYDSTLLSRIGWKTSTTTRPQLISLLDQAIREYSIIIRNPGTLSELRTFVHKPTGKTEHDEGCHDDRVIALGLAVVGILHAPADTRLNEIKRFRPPENKSASGGVRTYGVRRPLEPARDRGTLVRL